MKLPLMKQWRWWAFTAGAALVIQRFQRKRSARTGAAPHDANTASVEPLVPTDKELSEIFVLGRHFVETRAAETDTARDACLRRAAEIVLKGRPGAAALVTATHRDAFVRACRSPMRREHACERCGAPMRETSVFDAGVGESLPAWICGRCGAQTPR